ncbi:MAG: transglutaminase domain-containing protein, partial [Promethearchaeota archaeon]
MPKGSSRTVKNIIKLISVAAVILVIYSATSIISYKLWNPQANKYTRSDQGSGYSINDNVDQTPIYLNWDDYIDALMNSAFFDSMSDLEKAQFIADLLGEDVGDYIANQNLTADEFLDMYGDDLTDMLGSMSGENFSSDLFDQFDDPMLLGAILAKPMFYAYEDNPFGRPWSDKDSTLFKISAYDEYSLENYDWTLGTLDNSGPYSGEGISDDIKYKIKYPLIITQSAMTPIPTLSTRPRIYNESLQSSPITPVGGIALRNQAYLGNVNLMTNFDIGDIGQSTNFSYQLLYDPADFEPSTYYSSLSYSMSDFTGNDAAVSACLSGPIQAGGSEMDWSAYATQNPNFNSVNQALQSDPSFTSATNTYEKMDAIVNYIGTNFVYNMMGQQRPPSGQDPIEWFCGSKESSFPFEFSALAVALGRLNDISCRYVSGYKNNDLLRLQGLPNSFTDTDEGNQQGYIYYLGDTYTWMEVYIPTSSTTGDWIEMDNQFNATPTVPNPEDMRLNLKFDGNWQPDPNGIDRFGQYAEDTEVSVEVNYTSAGSPMRSQTLSLYDQTYGRSISSFYTNTNGIASYTLNLANLEPGPHLLNFSTSYLGYTFSNLSIIDVVDDIDIYEVVNQTNYQVGANTNVTTHYSGYAWDPVLNRPVKNALITYSALKWPTVTDPTPTPPTYIPSPGYTVTDQTGNFSVDLDIMGYPIGDSGRNYTITSLFAAAFNITSDVQTLPAPYQALLALQFGPTFLYQQFGDYATYSWQNNTQFELKTDNYYHYIFGINTASADNSTTANYPNGPAFGLRSGPFSITLSAQLLNQTGGIDTTQINVTDETEGGRFLTTLTTDSNGLASQVYDISTEAAGNASLWTVGPHLIKMQWNQDSNAESYFWIFIEAPIMVDQSTEYYLDGKAGILPNRYHIDNRNPGDADPFNMTGTIQDAGTGEWLSPNFTIDYQLLDSNWQVMTFITSLNGTQTQIESTITSFHQNFRFLGSISLAASPVRTNIAFLGEWADLGYNWTNSWASTYWQTYFTSLGTSNDTSDGVMYLSDPSTSGFSVNGFVNGTQFSTYPSNTYDTTVRLNSTLNFTGQFMHDGFLIDGASITLLLNGNPLSSSVTGANGTINFPLVVIDNSLTPGNLNFTVKASYTSISGTFIEVQQDILWVPYDPTIGFEQDYLLENQLFSSYGSAYPITQGPGDSLNFSVHLWYNSGDGKVYDWANANIELRIDGILNSSTTTDAQGYATIIYNFGTWSTNGTHAFSLSISYNSGTFIYTDNVAIDVDYDENLLHQYKAWINGVPFENYPGYNYPNIQGSGDTVNISIQFLFDENHDKNYIPQQWVLITYTNDTYTEQIYTDANGYANFSIQFTSWANVG